jgi:hypothetical protein
MRIKGGCNINRKERKERRDPRKMGRFFVTSAFFAVTYATATQLDAISAKALLTA